MEHLRYNLSRNVRELAIASVVTKPLNVVNAAILLSCLPLHEFGLLALAQSIFTVINYFGGFGQGGLVVSRYVQLRVQGHEAEGLALFRSFCVLGLLGVAISTGVAFLSAFWFLQDYEITPGVFTVGVCIAILNPLRNIIFFYFQAQEKFRELKILDLSYRLLLTLGYCVWILGMGMGLLGVFIANAAAFIAPFLVAGSPFFKEIARALQSPKIDLVWNMMKSEGKWLSARWGLSKGHSSMRPWLIVSLLGTEAVALFEAAKTVLGICKDVVPLKKVLLPMMSREVLHDSRFTKLFQQSSCYAAWLYAVITFLIVVFAPVVFTVLFPKYQSSILLVQVMAMNLFFSGFAVPQPSLFFALEKQKIYFFTALLTLIVEILFGVVGMFWLNVLGMGIAFVASNLLVAWIRYFYLRNQDPRLQLDWKAFLRVDKDDRQFFWSLISAPKRA